MNRQQRRREARAARQKAESARGGGFSAQRLDDGLRLHQRGELERAEAIYRNVLRQQPNHPEALHLLGVLLHQKGASEEAVTYIERSLEQDPQSADATYNLADILLARGKTAEAVERFRHALTLRPDFPEAAISLGIALRSYGDMDQAVAQLREAATQYPDFAEAHYNLGDTLRIQNELDEAQAALEKALEIRADFAEAENNLASVLRAGGDIDGAADHLENALRINPNFAEAHNNLGNVQKVKGSLEAAIPHFEKAIALRPDFAEAHYNLGNAYLATGRAVEATQAFEQAIALNPEFETARAGLSEAQQRQVPRWHFAMMNDRARNEAYDQAIREAVSKDQTVLDIGTGAGLLAMMAARASAGHVYACETVAPIAGMAQRIVEQNGLAEKITVLPKHSYGLKIGEDLPEPADVMVTELLNAGFLGEGILQVIQHARASLLKPDAAIIPRGGTVYAALIESERLVEEDRVAEAAGFDVTPFNEFASVEYLTKRLNAYPHQFLSESVEVFSFDFTGPAPRPESKEMPLAATANGTCHAVLLWFRLDLTDKISIETKPREEDTHWRQAVYLEQTPRKVQAGETYRLLASHDCRYISLKLAAD
ncbi:MAG: tetratricopeptide repeat protein [Alphaproteobacteria bacterium]|nr:tetratricopeptide repeat protein [Alphaproteobacteria bacterium]